MGDSAHTTHHTAPGMAHCLQKCVSKYLRTEKKFDVSRLGFGIPIDLRQGKPGLEIWGQWVNQNDFPLMSKPTVGSCVTSHEIILLISNRSRVLKYTRYVVA
jgi:hypothetical protein